MRTTTLCPRCHDRGWYRLGGRLDLTPCDRPDCSAGVQYHNSLKPLATPKTPAVPAKPPEDPQAVRRVLAAQLRRAGEVRIARALELGNVKDLSQRELALLDATMTGRGYLVGGRRVDPEDVEVFSWREGTPGTF